jgi:methionyl-tRNA synthetase
MDKKESILLTTAISYTNGSPHIGHMYEAILADFIKRVYLIANYNIKLLTGTDEHGKKIQSTAENQQINPIELCNIYSNEFKQMNIKIGSSYDYFIRTTDTVHKDLVSKSIESILLTQNQFQSIPSIYLGEYSGYYNIREECYITEIQASQTNYCDPVTSKPYEIVKEPSWYLVLKKFLNQINSVTKNIEPVCFQDEICSRIKAGLDDLSITRTSFTWGIPFPISNLNDNNQHIIYVWFDALLNYVTGKNILFPNNFNSNSNVKPIHLIGKDILWFHSVIYPAVLEACGYSDLLPHKILIHGFVLDKDGRKMSKSLGNVLSNDELFEKYPIDAIRYYLISNTIFGQDFKFDPDNLINNYNNILIKGFGNLFQRLFKLIKPIQTKINVWLDININLLQLRQIDLKKLLRIVLNWDGNFNLYNEFLINLINKLNKDLTEKKPWSQDLETQLNILGNIVIDYYIVMCLMYPIIPFKVTELSKHLGWENKLKLDTREIYLSIPVEIDKPIAFESIKIFQTNTNTKKNNFTKTK